MRQDELGIKYKSFHILEISMVSTESVFFLPFFPSILFTSWLPLPLSSHRRMCDVQWVLFLCVCVCVQIGGYCEMPETGAIEISLNLMELKGHTDVSKCTYFLQATLICLGRVLCIWGRQTNNRTGFRNHPYLTVRWCVCVCVSLWLHSNPVSVLAHLPHLVDFIKPHRPHRSPALTPVLLLYELFSHWCLHLSGLCTAMDFSIIRCTILFLRWRAVGQKHYLLAFLL